MATSISSSRKERDIMSKIKKEKKELTPQQMKVRNIMGWVVSALCIALIIASLIISIVTIANAGNTKGELKGIGGNVFMPVQTDSMDPTFKAGDLIITKVYEGDGSDLKEGQVITYKRREGTNGGGVIEIFVTHRIDEFGVDRHGNPVVKVIGDNPDPKDGAFKSETVSMSDIVATWGTPAERNADGSFNITKDTKGGNMGQIGALINFIQNDKTNYFLVIVLPLIIIFLIYVFILVRSLVIAKIDKTKEEAMATAGVDGLSEEDKRRLAEEYLAQLARESASADADTDTTENNPFEDENTDKGDVQA